MREPAGLARYASAVRSRLGQLPLGDRLVRPELSVIVPFYNVEAYLAECLDSILGQSFTHFEVIVVDDGSPDGSRQIAEKYAEQDARVRLVTRPNGGLGAARNTGIREARGRYLTFVDSDDVIPEGAWAALVESAQASGSDIVVGAFRRFDGAHSWPPLWVEAVHCDPRVGIRLEDFRPLLRNLYTWNKLFRHDFWTAEGLWFREGVAYEDQPIITQLFARASAIDVIPDVVYRYRQRDDRSSISQQTATVKDLRDRIAAWRVSREVLRAELDPETYDSWLLTLFDVHFQWYLASPGTVDDTYWSELVGVVKEFAAETPASVWERTGPSRRILVGLALADRRADAQEFVRQRGTQLEWWPATLREDGVLVELPLYGDPELPESHFLLRPQQLTVWHSVENIHWSGESAADLICEISGRAYLGKVDLATHDARISVVLQNNDTGSQHEFVSVSTSPTSFPLPMEDQWCDYEPGTFHAVIPWSEVSDAEIGSTWRVLLRVAVGALCETRPMTTLLRRGAAGWVPAAVDPRSGRVLVEWQVGRTVLVRVAEPGSEIADLSIDGRAVRGTLTTARGIRRIVARRSTGESESTPLRSQRAFELHLPPVAERPLRGTGSVLWGVEGRGLRPRVLSRPRPVVPSVAVLPEASSDSVSGARGSITAETSRTGELILRDSVNDVIADEITPDEDGALTISGRVLGRDQGTLTLITRGIGGKAVSSPTEFHAGRFVATLPLTQRIARFGEWALPPGAHDVFALISNVSKADSRVRVQLSRELSQQLPITLTTESVQGHIVRAQESGVQLHLQRPLGAYNAEYQQNRLRSISQCKPLTRGLLLRSYFGETATDSGVAIQAELRRRGSDLPVYWAVHGHSVPVPEGTIPVIVKSPEWFALLDSASYYVDNMFQPEYHRKPEGQIVVQTFHGYPFKQMGLPHWRQQQFSQARIETYLSRIRDWDFLVSPASYATPLLARDFAFENQMLEIGYPRNDILSSVEGDEIRTITRAELGIREDQTVVLYAPTFRDYLALNNNRAAWPTFFDYQRAVDRLGERFVILVRGHAFNARVKQRVAMPAGCIDVTDYPEVSDLYLAADASVVDYSSLRFDFGITKKPMIFHVPDLQRYHDSRGWLLDFEPTAPGPLVNTTDEVVDHLLDLDRVSKDWAPAYAAFAANFLDLDDGHAAARFVDAVFAPRGDA